MRARLYRVVRRAVEEGLAMAPRRLSKAGLELEKLEPGTPELERAVELMADEVFLALDEVVDWE